MPVDILMPALSPTMTEGKLAKWLKQEGEAVKSGDVIAEIETDKATMEMEAIDDGVLGKIFVPSGTDGVKVNQIIGVLLLDGENAAAIKQPAAAPAVAAPAAAPASVQAQAVLEAKPSAAPSAPSAPIAAADQGKRVFASPLARRLAQEAGIDLAALHGSGPYGRIVKADIEKAKNAPAVAKTLPGADFGPAYQEIPLSSMRKTIARRLTEAKQTVPHFYLTIDCRIDALLTLRKDLNQRLDGGKLSVNDFVIRAVALALRKVPAANASFAETHIRQFTDVDISVAVAIPDGLITPVIRNADQKSLVQLSGEMRELAVRARDGKLKPEEFMGGGFSISNLGMYGIREFGAIINPPQGCILAVGAGEERPVVTNGVLGIGTMMSCTLSVDHRVVDGAIGAEFLAAFKKLIEDPLLMVL